MSLGCVDQVRRASDKKDLDESVPWAKHTGITWLRDGRGFFYSRYRTPSDIAIGDGAAGGKDAGTEVDANSHQVRARARADPHRRPRLAPAISIESTPLNATERNSILVLGLPFSNRRLGRSQMVYFHLIGTPASQDRLVFRSPENPLWLIGADVTEDGRYLLILPRNGCDPVNRLFFCDLHVHFDAWIAAGDRARAEALGRGLSGVPDGEGPQIPHVKFVDNFEAEYEYLANDGALMFFKTNLHAPKNRVVRVRLPATADGKEPTADDIAAALCVENTRTTRFREMVGVRKGDVGGEDNVWTGSARLLVPDCVRGWNESFAPSSRLRSALTCLLLALALLRSATMEDVIPESLRGHVLESACVMARSRILCVYMEDVVNSARVFRSVREGNDPSRSPSLSSSASFSLSPSNTCALRHSLPPLFFRGPRRAAACTIRRYRAWRSRCLRPGRCRPSAGSGRTGRCSSCSRRTCTRRA